MARTAAVISQMETDPNGPLHQSHIEAAKASGERQRSRRPVLDNLEQALILCNDDDFKLIVDQALTFTLRLATGRVQRSA